MKRITDVLKDVFYCFSVHMDDFDARGKQNT